MRRSILIRTMSVVISVSLLAFLVVACSKVEIKKFEVSPEDIEVEVGSTVDLEITLKTDPRDADIEIVYSSSDDSVAEVDDEGTITGISEGECEITVSVGDEEKTVDVLVYESEADILDLEDHVLNEPVETDIVRFTLINAQLAIKLNSTSTGTYEDIQNGTTQISSDYFTADDYNPATDSGLAYVAGTGHTFVAMEFLIENIGRGTVEFDPAGFGSSFSVSYNGETYYPDDTEYGATSTNGYQWERYNSSNVLLFGGEAAYYRCYVDIPTEAEDLNDDFYVAVSMPVSDDSTETFLYEVTSSDRIVVQSQEISVDEALATFLTDEGQEYFQNHMNDFELMTGDEINSSIIGRNWHVDIRLSVGTFSGAYNFESDGDVEETIYDGSVGYFNERWWQIDGDTLIIGSGSNTAGTFYQVRRISNNSYLLVDGNEPVGIMYSGLL